MSEKLTCSNDTLLDQSLLATAKDLQVGHFRTRAAASPLNASSDRFPPDTVSEATVPIYYESPMSTRAEDRR
jgi:hypothetical protein